MHRPVEPQQMTRSLIQHSHIWRTQDPRLVKEKCVESKRCCAEPFLLVHRSETAALTFFFLLVNLSCQLSINQLRSIRSVGGASGATHDVLALSSLWNARITVKCMDCDCMSVLTMPS